MGSRADPARAPSLVGRTAPRSGSAPRRTALAPARHGCDAVPGPAELDHPVLLGPGAALAGPRRGVQDVRAPQEQQGTSGARQAGTGFRTPGASLNQRGAMSSRADVTA